MIAYTDHFNDSELVSIDSPEDLEELHTTTTALLIYFYTNNSGSCKIMSRIIQNLELECNETIATVNVNTQEEVSRRYQIQNVPTLIIPNGSNCYTEIEGVQTERTLKCMIRNALYRKCK